MKLSPLALILAALLAPSFAHAAERELDGLLATARACLAKVGALRGTQAFEQRQMGGLARKIASDIDYAETWSRHDTAMAERYLLPAQDCERLMAAWRDSHPPHGPVPRRRDEPAFTEIHWSPDLIPAPPDLSFLITGRSRRPGAARNLGWEGVAAAWDNPYSR